MRDTGIKKVYGVMGLDPTRNLTQNLTPMFLMKFDDFPMKFDDFR